MVRKRAERLGEVLPDDVAEYVAEHVRTNVRELEGAVTRVVGFAALTGSPLDLDLAMDALKDVAAHRRRQVTLDHISSVVTSHFGVRLAELQSKRRTQVIAVPRQVCMYLARRLTSYSLKEIGRFFGGKNHTTVVFAVQAIEEKVVKSRTLGDEVEHLRKTLQGEGRNRRPGR